MILYNKQEHVYTKKQKLKTTRWQALRSLRSRQVGFIALDFVLAFALSLLALSLSAPNPFYSRLPLSYGAEQGREAKLGSLGRGCLDDRIF